MGSERVSGRWQQNRRKGELLGAKETRFRSCVSLGRCGDHRLTKDRGGWWQPGAVAGNLESSMRSMAVYNRRGHEIKFQPATFRTPQNSPILFFHSAFGGIICSFQPKAFPADDLRPGKGCANSPKWAKTASQMAKTTQKPPFSVISPQEITPPRPLGTHGLRLWQEVQQEYRIQECRQARIAQRSVPRWIVPRAARPSITRGACRIRQGRCWPAAGARLSARNWRPGRLSCARWNGLASASASSRPGVLAGRRSLMGGEPCPAPGNRSIPSFGGSSAPRFSSCFPSWSKRRCGNAARSASRTPKST